jgi:hypothetical protein
VQEATGLIKTIDSVPTHLPAPLLDAIYCAGLELCTAILSYLKIVIMDIDMGVLRMSLLLESYLENTATTLVHGEGSFTEGTEAISKALETYRKCFVDLTVPLLAEIQQDTRSMVVAPKMKDFYEWLSPQGVYTKHKTIGKELEFCAGSSVPEFLLSDKFQQWSQTPSNLLFCHGNRTFFFCTLLIRL